MVQKIIFVLLIFGAIFYLKGGLPANLTGAFNHAADIVKHEAGNFHLKLPFAESPSDYLSRLKIPFFANLTASSTASATAPEISEIKNKIRDPLLTIKKEVITPQPLKT